MPEKTTVKPVAAATPVASTAEPVQIPKDGAFANAWKRPHMAAMMNAVNEELKKAFDNRNGVEV